jgi:toxin ParE1/3/4
MSRYELSESAEADLLSIFVYTLQRWDLEQAGLYENQITNAFERIADDPFLLGSKAHDQYADGCRFFKTGKHIVVYLSGQTPIGIARILHESMDFDQHVSEEFYP